MGHNVNSRSEVDETMAQVRKAGAIIIKSVHDTFWGNYAGYFQDPDGHLRELVWNPEWELQGE
jgi:predicted lactoylglutathione lyase